MTSHTIEFNPQDLLQATHQKPDIAICTMYAPPVVQYLPLDAAPVDSWDISPASVVAVGVGIWTAATGAALYLGWG